MLHVLVESFQKMQGRQMPPEGGKNNYIDTAIQTLSR